MPSRNEAIEALYEAKAAELRVAVRRAVCRLPDDLIEEACAHAWCQLVDCEKVAAEEASFNWLYVVAIRHGYRLGNRTSREPAVGLPEDMPALTAPDVWSNVERNLDRLQRRELLAQVPERKRRLAILQAAGFSYQEMARMTGDSLRTVERQLLSAKRTIRQLHRAHP